MTTTNYTNPVTLIRLAHPTNLSVVEFAYTPRYMRWTMIKYNPGAGQTASDAWNRLCESDLIKPVKFEAISHGATSLYHDELVSIVGHLVLTGWSITENRPYDGPSGYYECSAAETSQAAEAEDFVLS